MKKVFLILTLSVIFAASVFCKATESTVSYQTVPILKVLDAKDAYVVIYQKNVVGTSSTVVPKKWLKWSKDNPAKLKIRSVKRPNEAYMTVYKKDGNFWKVYLNVPESKLSPVWGMVDYHKQLEGTDKETLEELEL